MARPFRSFDRAVRNDELHHLGGGRADLHGPDRLRHPEDQGAVRCGVGYGHGGEDRHLRRAQPLPQLHQPVPVPDDAHGPATLMQPGAGMIMAMLGFLAAVSGCDPANGPATWSANYNARYDVLAHCLAGQYAANRRVYTSHRPADAAGPNASTQEP